MQHCPHVHTIPRPGHSHPPAFRVLFSADRSITKREEERNQFIFQSINFNANYYSLRRSAAVFLSRSLSLWNSMLGWKKHKHRNENMAAWWCETKHATILKRETWLYCNCHSSHISTQSTHAYIHSYGAAHFSTSLCGRCLTPNDEKRKLRWCDHIQFTNF